MTIRYYVQLHIQEHCVDADDNTTDYQEDPNPYYFSGYRDTADEAAEYASEIINAFENPIAHCSDCDIPIAAAGVIIDGLPYCPDCAKLK